MEILYGVVGIVLLIVLFKILSFPLKVLKKLIINGVIGIVLLYITNLIGGTIGVSIAINPITALIAGFFGIPGVIFLIVYKLFL